MNENRATPAPLRELSSQTAWSWSANRAPKTASGSHQASTTRRASATVPGAGRGRAGRRVPSVVAGGRCGALRGRGAEVLEQRPAVARADGLGVELHAEQRARAMLERHDHPVRRPGRHPQLRRHDADHERVVADGEEVLRDPGEQRAVVVVDAAEAPVHDLGRVLDRAAADVREVLVPEADAEHRHLGAAQDLERDAGVPRMLGPSGPGRDHDVVRMQRGEVVPGQLVVAHDDRLLAVDLAEEMEEVEGVGVVVVDQQRAHR